MNLIAKEMTSTFLGEDDQEVPEYSANVPSSYKMSAEELFYAQMNGEAIHSPANTEGTGISPDKNLDTSAGSLDFDDDCSFGALTIPDELRAAPIDKNDATNRRCSVESGSKTSSQGKASSKGSKASARSSGTKKSIRSESSGSSSGEETLSIEEIQEYVMNNLPPEVRDKIPKEAWSQIFGKSMLAKTRRKSSKDTKKCEVEDDDDDSSTISDITEFTTHPGSVIESTHAARDQKPEELDWDEEVCPGLDVSRRSSDPDNKSKSSKGSNSSGEGGSQRYRIDSSGNVCSNQTGNAKVSFSYVQVRYYERILEINPAVTSGPAIGIGWKFRRGGQMDVEDWELQRGGPGRRNNELILPREVRERILKDVGYDQKQIAEAVRIIRKAKDRRRVTVQNLGGNTEAMEETVEAASRRIMGILSFGTKRGLLKS